DGAVRRLGTLASAPGAYALRLAGAYSGGDAPHTGIGVSSASHFFSRWRSNVSATSTATPWWSSTVPIATYGPIVRYGNGGQWPGNSVTSTSPCVSSSVTNWSGLWSCVYVCRAVATIPATRTFRRRCDRNARLSITGGPGVVTGAANSSNSGGPSTKPSSSHWSRSRCSGE